jgi:hypothetical protein
MALWPARASCSRTLETQTATADAALVQSPDARRQPPDSRARNLPNRFVLVVVPSSRSANPGSGGPKFRGESRGDLQEALARSERESVS